MRQLLPPDQLGPKLPLLGMSLVLALASYPLFLVSVGAGVVSLALAFVCAVAAKQR